MEQIPQIIHPSWHSHLQPLFDDNRMKVLKYEILPKVPFYPEASNIFRVFSMPLDKIRVVIIGQDPYPNGEAVGLAFAIDRFKDVPYSLKKIKEEVYTSRAEQHDTIYYSKWNTLDHWHEQGVFLLNAALTTEQKKTGAHLKYWEFFTQAVVRIISTKVNPCPIWLFWGAKARAYSSFVNLYRRYIPNTNQEVRVKCNFGLEAPHPAAEAYGNGGFMGCNHFIHVNTILKGRDYYSILNKDNVIYW